MVTTPTSVYDAIHLIKDLGNRFPILCGPVENNNKKQKQQQNKNKHKKQSKTIWSNTLPGVG